MKLMTTCERLCAVLVLGLCFAPGNWAQQAKPAKKVKPAKPAASAPAQPEKPGEAAGDASPAANAEPTAPKRDPFAILISNQKDQNTGVHLPPGKAGLVIATVRVDGTVRSGTAMIAVVSNPGNSVYFIREGDRLYDGEVEKIGLDGVTFREESKDAFGHAVERTVTKRIYASAGE